MSHSSRSAIWLIVYICFVIILSGCKAKLASDDKGNYPTNVPYAIEELSSTINKLSAQGPSEFVSPQEVAKKGGIQKIELQERFDKQIQDSIAEAINQARERASLPDKLNSLNR
jgi:hypothetical protein